MFEKLLERIKKGGSLTAQSLAVEFGVSHEMMDMMLDGLVRAGYIQLQESCEAGSCSGCNFASACKPQGKTWMLVKEI